MKLKYNPERLEFNKITWWERNRIAVIVIAVLSLLTVFFAFQETVIQKQIVEGETVSTIIIPEPQFSPQLLREYMKEINMKFPDIVYAQAVIETGQFSSTIFKENHNLFGMKCAKSRAYTHLGESRNHAQYENWKMSVLDYALYQARYLGSLKTREQYYAYIGSHYAEDPSYLKKVKKIVKKLNYK